MSRTLAMTPTLVTLGLAVSVVVSTTPANLNALIFWAVLLIWWVVHRFRSAGWRAGTITLVGQLTLMVGLVGAAILAPGKMADRVKARRITLPKPAMTIGELREPRAVEPWSPQHEIRAPDDFAGQVIRFPACDLTVGDLIATIEAQTPLRHRFGHCGNGSTILNGGNCVFGLSFQVPPG